VCGVWKRLEDNLEAVVLVTGGMEEAKEVVAAVVLAELERGWTSKGR